MRTPSPNRTTRTLNSQLTLERSLWYVWWQEQNWFQRLIPVVFYFIYLGIIGKFSTLQSDHFMIAGAALSLWYLGPRLRPLFKFLLPLLLVAIIYDSMRIYGDYIRGPIHVAEPYQFDKSFFGITTPEGILTPNEWWQKHTHWLLDFYTGFFSESTPYDRL